MTTSTSADSNPPTAEGMSSFAPSNEGEKIDINGFGLAPEKAEGGWYDTDPTRPADWPPLRPPTMRLAEWEVHLGHVMNPARVYCTRCGMTEEQIEDFGSPCRPATEQDPLWAALQAVVNR